MVKKAPNPDAKGKGAASASAPLLAAPPPKPSPGSVKSRKKMFKKKKAPADQEKQKVTDAAKVAEKKGDDEKMVAEKNSEGSKTATSKNNGDGSKTATDKNDGAEKKVVTANNGAVRRPKEEGRGRMTGRGEERKEDKRGADESGAAGFIFMCNAKTKPECFKNGVFGLPKGKIDVVKKVHLGSKLFLYDFDLKLLYGVYKATGKGGMDLVRRAFDGRFPAQVKFKIDKDCLPLPESSFKHAIEENYDAKGRFTQELSSRQVRKLMALYKPVNLRRSSSQHVEEIRQTPCVEGRMPQYVQERRQPHDYEERRLSRHDEEMQRSRFVEDGRLTYGYDERQPPHHVKEIRRPQFVEEVRAPTHLPVSYVPPYYHRVPPASSDVYNPHPANILYESSAPRASFDATNRDPLLSRDYRALPAEVAPRPDRVDELYHSYILANRPEGLHQDPYLTTAYENPRPTYPESIQMPASTRVPVSQYLTTAYENSRPAYPESIQMPASTRVPVSSLYSFAGAPAYR